MKLLPKQWIDFLVKEPETGMGYQIVGITLKSGKTISDVPIMNCSFIGDSKKEWTEFNPSDITHMQVKIGETQRAYEASQKL
jgi:hypothetical protein